MNINKTHIISTILLISLLSACKTPFLHQKHKLTKIFIEKKQVENEVTYAESPEIDVKNQKVFFQKNNNDSLELKMNDEFKSKNLKRIKNTEQFHNTIEFSKIKKVVFQTKELVVKQTNDELAEKYRKKSNAVMILFFVALAIGIFLCIVLSEYLTVAAVIGTLIQMMFFIIHAAMRKRQIQYTENETAKSKAIFLKKFMKAMFIVVVIAGITLFFIGLLVIW